MTPIRIAQVVEATTGGVARHLITPPPIVADTSRGPPAARYLTGALPSRFTG